MEKIIDEITIMLLLLKRNSKVKRILETILAMVLITVITIIMLSLKLEAENNTKNIQLQEKIAQYNQCYDCTTHN